MDVELTFDTKVGVSEVSSALLEKSNLSWKGWRISSLQSTCRLIHHRQIMAAFSIEEREVRGWWRSLRESGATIKC